MSTDLLGRLLRMLQRLGRHQPSTRDAEVPKPSEALGLLRRGAITLEEYLATHVDLAVAPLGELLDASDIAFIRAILWERLETDPVLVRLVERLRR
jgi:hypothetical protein